MVRLVESRHSAALRNHLAAVAVDRERHDRVAEALAIVIEIENRIGEGVSKRVMQRLVGIRRIEPLIDQATSQHLGRVTVSRQLIGPVGLVPDIVARRREGEIVVRADAVRRNDVLAEVLVLVVAPYQDEVRVERIERRPCLFHPADQIGAMPGRGCGAMVVPPLRPHRLRPALRRPQMRRQVGVLQHAPQNSRHAFVGAGQRRIVRYAERQNLCHGVSSLLIVRPHAGPLAGGRPVARGQALYRRSVALLARRLRPCAVRTRSWPTAGPTAGTLRSRSGASCAGC